MSLDLDALEVGLRQGRRRPDDFDLVPTRWSLDNGWHEAPRWYAQAHPDWVVWDYRHNLEGQEERA